MFAGKDKLCFYLAAGDVLLVDCFENLSTTDY